MDPISHHYQYVLRRYWCPAIVALSLVQPACSTEERCDWKDNDKDLIIDEGFDVDGDTYWQCGITESLYLAGEFDCNDSDPDINPGEQEVCDGKDNNCDNVIDEGCDIIATYSGSIVDLYAWDMNRDEYADALVLYQDSGHYALGMMQADADGQLSPMEVFGFYENHEVSALQPVDFNSDVHLDFLAIGPTEAIILSSLPDGGVEYQLDYYLSGEFFFDTLDIDYLGHNNAGGSAFILGGSGLSAVANFFTLSLTEDALEIRHLVEVESLSSDFIGLEVGDINGQNAQDIIFAAGAGIGWLFGKSDGSFEPGGTIELPSKIAQMATGDLDGDGMVEVVVTLPEVWKLLILKSTDTGVFSDIMEVDAYRHPYGLTLVDIDGDDVLDIAVSSADEAELLFLKNRGDLKFDIACRYPSGALPGRLVPIEFGGAPPSSGLLVANEQDSTIMLNTGFCQP